MGSTLTIQFDLPDLPAMRARGGDPSAARIPVQIRRVGEGAQGAPDTVLVPLREGQGSIALEPGSYLLRTTLPSGRYLSETIEVHEGSDAHATLSAESSPAHPAGVLPWTVRPSESFALPAAMKSRYLKMEGRRSGMGMPISDWSKTSITARFWEESEAGWKPWSSPASVLVDDLFQADGVLTLWSGNTTVEDRIWMELLFPEKSSKLTLLPPSSEEGGARVQIQLVKASDKEADPYHLIVENGNESASVLLAYMHAGNGRAASAVGGYLLDSARELLAGKFNDYTSAAIAAYFMHQYKTADATGWWPGWLKNLDFQFPAHADGAILDGWMLLKLGEASAARKRFLEAERRGMPLFTTGVRLLLDGLDLSMNDDHDEQVNAALARLRWNSSTVDWTEAVCTRWGSLSAGHFVAIPCGESSLRTTRDTSRRQNEGFMEG